MAQRTQSTTEKRSLPLSVLCEILCALCVVLLQLAQKAENIIGVARQVLVGKVGIEDQ